MAAAWDRGVNFFDNAEAYALGKSEEIMGEALKKLAWPRVRYVVSTKFFWGLNDGPERAQHAQPQVPHARDRRRR
jgi:aryl-alcohol dehydrogenase-like predicted oxidoreductase